jgi:EAL domain-containing protein (putative c-di-GMP-specific phosphodiesterase class I)/CheY-like chemotaxis protein
LEDKTPRCLLLVDDEPSIRMALSHILERAGYKVVTVTNGSEALEELRIHASMFDVVISDIRMPGASGLEVLKSIRERDLDVPVILIAGSPTFASAAEAVRYGAFRYLEKPIDHDLLLLVVKEAIRFHDVARLRRESVMVLEKARESGGSRELDLSDKFQNALKSLHMVYQPIVSVGQHDLFGYEALLRCDRAFFPNTEVFIVTAEQLGRVHDLGRAVRSAVAPMVFKAPSEFVFVNLHPLDIMDTELFAEASPLSAVASKVVLEITERASLDNAEHLRRQVEKLRSLGYLLAVDDLGAGYAGLTSILHIKPDVVKFDMIFTRGIDQDPIRKKLVSSMAAGFHQMNIITIAEGVETVAERDTLIECGVDAMQGYLFAKPGLPFPVAQWGNGNGG